MCNSKNILVIEDDDLIKVMLCEFIVSHGFHPVPCSDVSILDYQKREVDFLCVFLDAHLGVDSTDIYNKIRSKYPHVPIVIMSGGPIEERQTNTLIEMGADKFLSKPFEMSCFLNIIDSYYQGNKPYPC